MVRRALSPIAGMLPLLVVAGCNWMWPTDGPYDPWRCDPRCPPGRACVVGKCVPLEAGAGPDLHGRFDLGEAGPDHQLQGKCGDGEINGLEQCDSFQLGGKSCQSLGYERGNLACNEDCTLDKHDCSTCGDGKISGNESCDVNTTGGVSCQSLGFDGGSLTCLQCVLGTDGCYKCGDNKINGTEQCDGSQLGGKNCADVGFFDGTLACKTDCTFDTAGCHNCGNKVVNGTEQCDGSQLGGKTCADVGFDGGTLACKADCAFETAGCYKCGDQVINGPIEQCDGTDLGNETCVTQGFDYGTLACGGDCVFDTADCQKLTWVTISKGTFTMGSPTSEACRGSEDEHQVTLTQDFEISAHEVTQGQFQPLMNFGGTWNPNCGATCPASTLSWHAAAAFCNALSDQKGYTKCYQCTQGSSPQMVSCSEDPTYSGAKIYACPGYRLPTEAEWEYAYRAGTSTAYYNGNNDAACCFDCSTADANADTIGWYCVNSSVSYAGCFDLSSFYGGPACAGDHPVGQKPPNAWGLYDMAGNVMEWCHDLYQPNLGFWPVLDPWGAAAGSDRVVRGGSWERGAFALRAAFREAYPATVGAGIISVGFRCVRTLPSP
jgi:formylglycine-generating enzyme required for sulfatase activity